MNRKIITTLLVLSVPLNALALPPEQGDSRWPDKGQRVERLTKELGLTTEQKSKVETIFNEEHVKFKALHEETKTHLQGVLTQEQMTKFEALHQQRQNKHPSIEKTQ